MALSALLLNQPATWWVGGPLTLLPLVLVGGLFIGHKLQRFTAGRRVQVQLDRPGSVFWTADSWATRAAIEALDTTLGVWVAELPTAIMRPGAVMEWTAQYAEAWEGQNYALTCMAAED